LIAYAKLIDINGTVELDGIPIRCKVPRNQKVKITPLKVVIGGQDYFTVGEDRIVDFIRAEDVGRTVIIGYPERLEDATILGVL
jgi:hypothetical protein